MNKPIPTPDVPPVDITNNRMEWNWYDFFARLAAKFVSLFVDSQGRSIFYTHQNYNPDDATAAFQVGPVFGQVYSVGYNRWAYVAGGFGFSEPSFIGAFSRNPGYAQHTAINVGDLTVRLGGYGSNGVNFVNSGSIYFIAETVNFGGVIAGRFEVWPTNQGGSEVRRLVVDSRGNVAMPNVLGTNASDGFLWIPIISGPPTGVPNATYVGLGLAPLVVDGTNLRLYFYAAGAWRNAGPG